MKTQSTCMSVCTPARMFTPIIYRPEVTLGTYLRHYQNGTWQRLLCLITVVKCYITFSLLDMYLALRSVRWNVLRRHFRHCVSFHAGRRTTHSVIYHCCSAVSYNTCHGCYQLYYRSFVQLPNSVYAHYQVSPSHSLSSF